jgi:CubicO group peptidase (beta-lactamase class C family)
MSLRINLRLLDIVRKASEGKGREVNYVRFEPWKKRFPEDAPVKQPFKRCAPEEVGVSSEYLQEFLKNLANAPETAIHSFMILRKGAVIAEGSFEPYKTKMWHVSNSLSKSIVALAVGIAVGEGRLKVDDTVIDILKGRSLPISAMLKRNLKVKHLLTMTSGLSGNEAVAATENDWTKVVLESNQLFAPGAHFNYNSMNTYLLAVILNEVTGQGLMDYIRNRLLVPMGIETLVWEKSPEGIEKGGWGMYITIEDMAKFGQLCLNKGKWNGRQLVPESWIAEMTKCRVDSKEGRGMYGYGYQVWMGKRPGSFLFNGMFGQIVYVIPDLETVLCFTGGSDNMFRDNATNINIEKYFNDPFPEGPLPENRKAYNRLLKYIAGISYGTAVDTAAERYGIHFRGYYIWRIKKNAMKLAAGRKFRVPGDAIGLMPMYIQYVHNNISEGIREVELRDNNGTLELVVAEGKDVNVIPVGFEEYIHSFITERSEEYNIASKCTFCINEDKIPVLKIKIVFTETENYRTVTFYFDQGKTWLEFNENPSVDMILDSMDNFFPKYGGAALLNQALEKIDPDIIGYALRFTFNPKVRLEEITEEQDEQK